MGNFIQNDEFCSSFSLSFSSKIKFCWVLRENSQALPIFSPLPLSLPLPTKHHSCFLIIFSHIFHSHFFILPKITPTRHVLKPNIVIVLGRKQNNIFLTIISIWPVIVDMRKIKPCIQFFLNEQYPTVDYFIL